MEIEVRRATAEDAEGARRVIRAVYDEYGLTWEPERYHADLYDLEGHYLRPGFPFLVAEAEGRIVGTAALDLFEPVPGPAGDTTVLDGTVRIGGCDCSLERLYVHPEARRQRIGLRLTEAVLAEARHRSRRLMEIWSDKRFVEAHRLYEKLGAKMAGDRICDDPDESPEWGLWLAVPGG
jgi:putative acetyltransferase